MEQGSSGAFGKSVDAVVPISYSIICHASGGQLQSYKGRDTNVVRGKPCPRENTATSGCCLIVLSVINAIKKSNRKTDYAPIEARHRNICENKGCGSRRRRRESGYKND